MHAKARLGGVTVRNSFAWRDTLQLNVLTRKRIIRYSTNHIGRVNGRIAHATLIVITSILGVFLQIIFYQILMNTTDVVLS